MVLREPLANLWGKLFILTTFDREQPFDNLEDSAQLSDHISGLSPSERPGCIVGLLLRATKSSRKTNFLMSLPESQVLDIVEDAREVHPFSLFIQYRGNPELNYAHLF